MTFEQHAADTTPRMKRGQEHRRNEIVDSLDPEVLTGRPVFDDISQAMAAVTGAPHAFVALMENDRQCIVGQLDDRIEVKLERTHSFCTHTLAAGRVTIVEDASEDERFRDNPLVRADNGLRFYVGLPVFVDDVPVGTVCATATTPRTIDPGRRAEMFGLIRHVERFMETYYRQTEGAVERDVVERLTRIAMESVKSRWQDVSREVDQSMINTEQHIDYLYDRLGEMGDLPNVYNFSEWGGD